MNFRENFRLLTYGPETKGMIARPVEEVDWPDIPRLYRYMVDVMRKADGLGLTAPQIGCFKQVMLLEMANRSVGCLLNPEVTRLYGDEVSGLEWCSNMPPPGNQCVVPRMGRVDIEASLAGAPGVRKKFTFTGPLARIVQHEIDHLHGIFFVDRIPEEHKRTAVLKRFCEWKSMRRAQIRKTEEDGHVNTGPFAVGRG